MITNEEWDEMSVAGKREWLRGQAISEAKRLDSAIMGCMFLQAELAYARQRIANLEDVLGVTMPFRDVDKQKYPDWPDWPCSCARGNR